MLVGMKINEKNLPLITVLNGDVEPKIEEETTYFVHNPDPEGYNAIVSETEFKEKFTIEEIIDPKDRHLIRQK